MKVGSLFSGYGGLDMAVAEFFGAEAAWHSEIDPGACQILAHHWPHVPNLGDITRIDWAQIEPVDILTGGWPCQPFSLAGKRKGALDERALWPYVAGAVRALRPRHVVLENVAAIASAGELARAVADLAALGYVGQWRCLRAADVGAPHGRARIFILATDAAQLGRWPARRDNGLRAEGLVPVAATHTLSVGRGGWPGQLWPGRRAEPAHSSGGAPADAEGNGWHQGRPEPARLVGGSDAAQRGHAPADADGDGLQSVGRLEPVGRDPDGCSSADVAWGAGERAAATDTGGQRRDPAGSHDGAALRARAQEEGSQSQVGRLAARAGRSGEVNWGPYEPAIRRWERTLGRPAPAPTETSRNGGQRLSPAFVEWMMGLPAGHVTAVPGLGRNAQLKALGNGVVPRQAFEALRRMLPSAVAA